MRLQSFLGTLTLASAPQYDQPAVVKFEPFEMERMQSTWEHRVAYNLSESGVHPLTLSELVEPGTLGDTVLGYPQTNGSDELRERVSELHPGAGPRNVVVTNGTAEANFLSILNLVEPGDAVVVMSPNYMQIRGLARSLGARVVPLPLIEKERWAPDLDALARAVTDKTRLIAVCNPNNPTGSVLSEGDSREICRLAERVGAWVLSDEVYRGAELGEDLTPTLWGSTDRLLVTGGLSKAYGLPGLRIGWVVGPPEKVQELWSAKDYTTISPGALSQRLACVALEPARRRRILERTRSILRERLPLLERWTKDQDGIFSMTTPRAGAIALLRYTLKINSTEMITRLREEKSVLIVPGDHFNIDHTVRIGFGGQADILSRGLELFSELLAGLRGSEA